MYNSENPLYIATYECKRYWLHTYHCDTLLKCSVNLVNPGLFSSSASLAQLNISYIYTHVVLSVRLLGTTRDSHPACKSIQHPVESFVLLKFQPWSQILSVSCTSKCVHYHIQYKHTHSIVTLPYSQYSNITIVTVWTKYCYVMYTYFAEAEIILGAGANFAALSGISCFNYNNRISKR